MDKELRRRYNYLKNDIDLIVEKIGKFLDEKSTKRELNTLEDYGKTREFKLETEEDVKLYTQLQEEYKEAQKALAEWSKENIIPEPFPIEFTQTKWKEDYDEEFMRNIEGVVVMALEINGRVIKTQMPAESLRIMWDFLGLNFVINESGRHLWETHVIESLPEKEKPYYHSLKPKENE